jgi:hypothetical protein
MQKWRVPQLEDHEIAVRDLATCTQKAQLILMHGLAIVGDYVIMYVQKVRDLYGIHAEAIKGMRDNMRLTFQRHKVDVLRGIFDAFSQKCSIQMLSVYAIDVACLIECVELVESWRADADPRWPRFVGDAAWTGDDIYDAARAVRGIPGLDHELFDGAVADAEGEDEDGDLQWWKRSAMRYRQDRGNGEGVGDRAGSGRVVGKSYWDGGTLGDEGGSPRDGRVAAWWGSVARRREPF